LVGFLLKKNSIFNTTKLFVLVIGFSFFISSCKKSGSGDDGTVLSYKASNVDPDPSVKLDPLDSSRIISIDFSSLFKNTSYALSIGGSDSNYELIFPENMTKIKTIGDATNSLSSSRPTNDSQSKFIKKISIPNSITKIEKKAFSTFKDMEELNLSSAVDLQHIGANAFNGVNSGNGISNQVTFPKSYIGYTSRNTLTDGERPLKGLKNISFPDSSKIASIVPYLFDKELVSLTFLGLVEESPFYVDGESFKDFASLTNVLLPKNTFAIGTKAFSGCEKLNTLDLSSLESLEVIYEHAFEASGINHLTIPPNVTSLGKSPLFLVDHFDKAIISPTSGTTQLTVKFTFQGDPNSKISASHKVFGDSSAEYTDGITFLVPLGWGSQYTNFLNSLGYSSSTGATITSYKP
jgi:hypothetical protein